MGTTRDYSGNFGNAYTDTGHTTGTTTSASGLIEVRTTLKTVHFALAEHNPRSGEGSVGRTMATSYIFRPTAHTGATARFTVLITEATATSAGGVVTATTSTVSQTSVTFDWVAVGYR
jgi:hypothetical protein